MVDILKEWFGHDPELYQHMLENLDKPFRPVAYHCGGMDSFQVLTQDVATVVHPVKGSLVFDLLCDYEGNVVGIQINGFKGLGLMSQELLDALDKYNMMRP